MIRRTRVMILGMKRGTLSHTNRLRSWFSRQTAQQSRPRLIITNQNENMPLIPQPVLRAGIALALAVIKEEEEEEVRDAPRRA